VQRWLVVGLAVANLAFVVAFALLMAAAPEISAAATAALVLALPVIAAGLDLATLVAAMMQWRGGVGTRMARLRYDAIVVVALVIIWSVNEWNLLGWRV
jgi:hypothetical protein